MLKHNIKAILNAQRQDKNGKYPLRIRTSIKRKVTYYSTGLMLFKDKWSGSEVIKHPNRVFYNIVIRNKITELDKTIYDQYISGEDIKKVKKIEPPTFGEYGKKVIRDQTGQLTNG